MNKPQQHYRVYAVVILSAQDSVTALLPVMARPQGGFTVGGPDAVASGLERSWIGPAIRAAEALLRNSCVAGFSIVQDDAPGSPAPVKLPPPVLDAIRNVNARISSMKPSLN